MSGSSAAPTAKKSTKETPLTLCQTRSQIAAASDQEEDDDNEDTAPQFSRLCPELQQQLQAAGLQLLVEQIDQQPLTPRLTEQIVPLQQVAQKKLAMNELPRPLLDTILTQIQNNFEKPPEPSWWERFKRWLFGVQQDQDTKDSWLSQWLRDHQPPTQLLEGIWYTLLISIVAGATYILLRETLESGALARLFGRRARTATKSTAAHNAPSSLRWANAAQLPPAQQAGLLLQLVIADLQQSGRLQTNASSTNWQVCGGLRTHAPELGKSFAELLRAMEPITYGDKAATSDDILRAAEDARRHNLWSGH